MIREDTRYESLTISRTSGRGPTVARRDACSRRGGCPLGRRVGRQPVAPRQHAAEAGYGLHGVELRGMYLASKDRLAEGRFDDAQAASGVRSPRRFADRPGEDHGRGPGDTDDENLNTSPRLFAGFTFIAQFVDHDITLDNTPLDLQQADPDARVNFRTPRYDLDSVYGRGPVADPDFYDLQTETSSCWRRMSTVSRTPRDIQGRAVIPEKATTRT